jgi:branched-chain amino acid transport system ATP-binding protein
MSKLLEVKNLSVNYGTVRAIDNSSIFVNEREIVAILGPNGAGKSTLLKAVCGLVPIAQGEILFRGKSIKGFTLDQLVKLGISLVPEGRRVFQSMTVVENLELGAFTINDRTTIKESLIKVFELFPVLRERKNQKAGTLSTGEQQMLSIGRALMLKLTLLLLDEPSLGLSPNYVELVFEKLVEINKQGTSILLVEQNTTKALEVCHRGYSVEMGAIVFSGSKNDLLRNEEISKIISS